MTLKDDALVGLKQAGQDVMTGLWSDQDGPFLQDCASKLADMQLQASATNDADLRDQYREAAQLLLNRVAAVMFQRANAAGNQAVQDVCSTALKIALKAVLSLIV
jgi:hypothetical protein